MKRMGRHNHANGHRGEDGAAAVATLEPFTFTPPIQVPSAGPVSAWPQQHGPSRWQKARHAVTSHRAAWQACLTAIPVVLVNAVAFGAQLGFWNAHLTVPLEAVLVALALESIATYLQWQAHLAQLADDSALRLRLASYGVALGIGALNYSHFDGPGWRPTVPAVTFGMMSAISPWLWSVHSRRTSRDALKARGLIEPHAVRLGGTRWAWHFIRSVRVMSAATWTGETDPAAAIATWRPRKTPGDAAPDAPEAVQESVSDETAAAPASPPSGPPPRVTNAVRRAPGRRTAPPSARARALALLKGNPGLDDGEVMKRTKASKSTVERARRDLAKAAPKGQDPEE